MSARVLCTALLGAVLVVGCDSERRAGRIVVDTVAGIPSISNPARGLLGNDVGWTLAEHLRTESGGDYDGIAASFILDVGVLPDGGVVVLDAGNYRVLRFDPAGAYLGSFGSEGERPGEFLVPLLLEVADSVIYVLDARLQALSAFEASGEYLFRFELDFGDRVGTSPVFTAGSPDEVYLLAEPAPFSDDTGRQGAAFRFDRSGSIADTVFSFPPAQWTTIRLPDGRATFAKPRLLAEPKLSARPGRLAVNAAARYVIDVLDSEGQVLRRVTRAYEPHAVTIEMRDSIIDVLASGPGSLPREALHLVPFAPIVPAIEGLTLDDRGRLWVDLFAPDEPERVDVFDEDGRFLGPLHLPARVKLEDVRAGLACGVTTEGHGGAICYRVEDS